MFLDSSNSSEDGSESVSVRSINMGYNEPQIHQNYAFDENFRDNRNPEMNTMDNVNVNMEIEEPGAQVNLGFEEDGPVNRHVNKTDDLTIF